MLIKLFKSKSNIFAAFLFLIAAFFWALQGSFREFPETVKPVMPLYKLVLYACSGSSWIASLVVFILIFVSALVLNRFSIKYSLVERKSYLPAFVFVLLTYSNPIFTRLNPALPAMLLVILAMNILFSNYGKKDAFREVFDASFLISLATLFYLPSIVFLTVIWITFLIFGAFNWREWIISFLGYIVPFMFLFTWYYWNDRLIQEIVLWKMTVALPEEIGLTDKLFALVNLGVSILLTIMAMFHILPRMHERLISIRKSFYVLILFAAIVLASFPFTRGFMNIHTVFLVIPASIYISTYLSEMKRRFWMEMLIGILFISIVLVELVS